jgi:hypothetical protein
VIGLRIVWVTALWRPNSRTRQMILRFPLLVEWLLACRSHRRRQHEFGNFINHYSQVRDSFNTSRHGLSSS